MEHFLAILSQKVCKSVQKCNRTSHAQKRAARTHIPHTFQNGFCTHVHMCDRTSHACVCARTFATHTLLFTITCILLYSLNSVAFLVRILLTFWKRLLLICFSDQKLPTTPCRFHLFRRKKAVEHRIEKECGQNSCHIYIGEILTRKAAGVS